MAEKQFNFTYQSILKLWQNISKLFRFVGILPSWSQVIATQLRPQEDWRKRILHVASIFLKESCPDQLMISGNWSFPRVQHPKFQSNPLKCPENYNKTKQQNRTNLISEVGMILSLCVTVPRKITKMSHKNATKYEYCKYNCSNQYKPVAMLTPAAATFRRAGDDIPADIKTLMELSTSWTWPATATATRIQKDSETRTNKSHHGTLSSISAQMCSLSVSSEQDAK